MLSRCFLISDFLESYLLIFEQNKYINVAKKILNNFFFTKQILVSKK